jgi:hypothetical protein
VRGAAGGAGVRVAGGVGGAGAAGDDSGLILLRDDCVEARVVLVVVYVLQVLQLQRLDLGLLRRVLVLVAEPRAAHHRTQTRRGRGVGRGGAVVVEGEGPGLPVAERGVGGEAGRGHELGDARSLAVPLLLEAREGAEERLRDGEARLG